MKEPAKTNPGPNGQLATRPARATPTLAGAAPPQESVNFAQEILSALDACLRGRRLKKERIVGIQQMIKTTPDEARKSFPPIDTAQLERVCRRWGKLKSTVDDPDIVAQVENCLSALCLGAELNKMIREPAPPATEAQLAYIWDRYWAIPLADRPQDPDELDACLTEDSLADGAPASGRLDAQEYAAALKAARDWLGFRQMVRTNNRSRQRKTMLNGQLALDQYESLAQGRLHVLRTHRELTWLVRQPKVVVIDWKRPTLAQIRLVRRLLNSYQEAWEMACLWIERSLYPRVACVRNLQSRQQMLRKVAQRYGYPSHRASEFLAEQLPNLTLAQQRAFLREINACDDETTPTTPDQWPRFNHSRGVPHPPRDLPRHRQIAILLAWRACSPARLREFMNEAFLRLSPADQSEFIECLHRPPMKRDYPRLLHIAWLILNRPLFHRHQLTTTEIYRHAKAAFDQTGIGVGNNQVQLEDAWKYARKLLPKLGRLSNAVPKRPKGSSASVALGFPSHLLTPPPRLRIPPRK